MPNNPVGPTSAAHGGSLSIFTYKKRTFDPCYNLDALDGKFDAVLVGFRVELTLIDGEIFGFGKATSAKVKSC